MTINAAAPTHASVPNDEASGVVSSKYMYTYSSTGTFNYNQPVNFITSEKRFELAVQDIYKVKRRENFLASSLRHFGLLAILIYLFFIISVILFIIYRFFDIKTINSVWLAAGTIGFGGLSIVIVSATKEIDET